MAPGGERARGAAAAQPGPGGSAGRHAHVFTAWHRSDAGGRRRHAPGLRDHDCPAQSPVQHLRHPMSRAHPPILRRPRGAVLFIALIMLILLTLIGVTGMQVTLLQERMSGNFRAQHQSFERAETRMIEGRDKVSDRLTAYDLISSREVALVDGKKLPWQSWLTTYPPSA